MQRGTTLCAGHVASRPGGSYGRIGRVSWMPVRRRGMMRRLAAPNGKPLRDGGWIGIRPERKIGLVGRNGQTVLDQFDRSPMRSIVVSVQA